MRPFSFIALLLGGAASLASADQVRLDDGSTITGEVLGLDAGTVLKLETGISPEPLSVRADQVQRVSFAHESGKPNQRDATLMLTNGDRMRCDVVSVDSGTVQIMTDCAGKLSIKREQVSSLELGIRQRRILYEGPKGLEDWKVDDGWQFEDDGLASEGNGSVSRGFDELPESFALSFRLSWAQRPNLQVYFCSASSQAGGGKHDRYYLQFNAAGFEVKRQSSGDQTYHTLGTVQRPPTSFNEPRANIELRVDRKRRMIQFYLDDKLEGTFPDPLPTSPKGDGVIFLSNLREGEGHLVTDIQLREWDSTGDRHRSEDRGDGEGDALIDYEGQRFSGKFLETKNKDGALVALFKSPHFPDALEIPLDQISTVFLSRPGEASNGGDLILGLAEGGFVSAAECRFVEDRVQLKHPLLGDMEIARSSVRSMVKRKASEDDTDTDNNSDKDEE